MQRRPLTPDINVTPLVDVVLVLLIIFMVIAPQMEAGAQVDVPGILNPDPKTEAKLEPITVSITKDGRAYFEREPIEREALIDRLGDVRRVDPDRRVVLKGDKGARYGAVRELFGICRDLGFPGVSLQVGEKEG